MQKTSAGNVDGFVLVFFCRRMGGEPGFLVCNELGGVLAEIIDGVKSQLARDVVGLIVGWGLNVGGPAVGGLKEFGEGFADVAVAGAVIVEVVFQFVGDGSELFEEVVGVLLAAGVMRIREEVMKGADALVEKLDEDEDAVARDVSGVAELFDLGVRERVVVALGVERHVERENSEGEAESSKHSGLVVEDLVEELVLDQIELFECGLDSGAIVL